jgi:hypothetical protein
VGWIKIWHRGLQKFELLWTFDSRAHGSNGNSALLSKANPDNVIAPVSIFSASAKRRLLRRQFVQSQYSVFVLICRVSPQEVPPCAKDVLAVWASNNAFGTRRYNNNAATVVALKLWIGDHPDAPMGRMEQSIGSELDSESPIRGIAVAI